MSALQGRSIQHEPSAMHYLDRRAFLKLAVGFAASAVWARSSPKSAKSSWREVPAAFPQGVASGDPSEDSVLLWTRSPPQPQGTSRLLVEVSENNAFTRVIAHSRVHLSSEADWTCRVLVGNLKPAHVYWYRFTDDRGNGSRVGRTITAPSPSDPRPVRFAFVSCQNYNQGAQNAYRRMIFEDELAPEQERLNFVLHLGDFIYEIVWYPEDRPQGMYDRKLRDIVRYPHGEKIQDFHIPTTLEDYRAVYRAYLTDPELQDARARWPFISMWDNHEFSWLGWQGLQKFGGKTRPAQTRKVAANQAFFEYQPARMIKPSGASLDAFRGPRVVDAPIDTFDQHGLGQEPNNLAAIASLKGYRSIRWGQNVELIITDQHSYRSEDPTDMAEAQSSTKIFRSFSRRRQWKFSTPGRSTATAIHPIASHTAAHTSPTFENINPLKLSWELNRNPGSLDACSRRKRSGSSGAILPERWICVPIPRTCLPVLLSLGPALAMPASAAAIRVQPTSSDPRFMTLFKPTTSLASLQLPETGIASGPAGRRHRFRLRNFNQSASPSLLVPSLLPAWWKH